jgi:hypothetical protein
MMILHPHQRSPLLDGNYLSVTAITTGRALADDTTIEVKSSTEAKQSQHQYERIESKSIVFKHYPTSVELELILVLCYLVLCASGNGHIVY